MAWQRREFLTRLGALAAVSRWTSASPGAAEPPRATAADEKAPEAGPLLLHHLRSPASMGESVPTSIQLAPDGTWQEPSPSACDLVSFRETTQPVHRLGYAIVGLGRVSLGEFLPGLRFARHAKPVALVSGSRVKAEIVARRYGVSQRSIYNYENFDRIADDPAIEAVYIALPNSLHAEYTERAARAGKHVLCEKPMATSVAEGEAMIAACRRAKRKLMIAYRCQYDPVTRRLRRLARGGALGRLQIINAHFGFDIAPFYTVMGVTRPEWRLNRAMAGGGPLVDVGIYCLNGARFVSGEEPVRVTATTSVSGHDPRFRTVEENLAWTFQFPSGLLAACSTSYGCNLGEEMQVVGARGSLRLQPAFAYGSQKLTGRTQTGEISFGPHDPGPQQFAAEADHLAECVRQDRQPWTPGEEGLRDLGWMEAIYRAAQA
jgi:predicted dehydrogenase